MTTLTVVHADERIGLYRNGQLEQEGETCNPAALLAWAAKERQFQVHLIYARPLREQPDFELPHDLVDLEVESEEDADWELALQ